MPAEVLEITGEIPAEVQFQRYFHRPTNLDAHERVYVVIEEICSSANLKLNDQPIGSISTGQAIAEFDITQQLAVRNTLQLTFNDSFPTGHSEPGTLIWEVVAIEIRS